MARSARIRCSAPPRACRGRRPSRSRPRSGRRDSRRAPRSTPGRPGEATEDEHAAQVVPGADEFLGHEVHAVVEAGDVAEVRGTVATMIAAGSWCWWCSTIGRARRSEPLVDPRRRAPRPRRAFGTFDHRSAGRSELEEEEAPSVLWKPLEKALDGKQALQDALRVVQAVHADTEETVGRQAEIRRTFARHSATEGADNASDSATRWRWDKGGRASAAAITTAWRSRSIRASR